MSQAKAPYDLYSDSINKKDPGASGTILIDRNPCYVGLISAAAETRTVARPTKVGAMLTLQMKTDGGDVTVTVTGGYDEDGNTTYTFSDVGQFLTLISCEAGGTFYWRKVADSDAVAGTLATQAGAGITAGTGTVYKSSVRKSGGIITTEILIDITGLHSEATDLDIIGVDGASSCHLGQITAARNGTILGGTMRCLEAPTGGDPNLSLYCADESTGAEDALITSLTADAVVFDPAADWTVDMDRSITGMPGPNQYLYLVQTDATGTDADYTAGKFLITLYGYDA